MGDRQLPREVLKPAVHEPLSVFSPIAPRPAAASIHGARAVATGRDAATPLNDGGAYRRIGRESPASASPRGRVRKVPPPSGQATGHKPGAGDRRHWNRNDTSRPDRCGARPRSEKARARKRREANPPRSEGRGSVERRILAGASRRRGVQTPKGSPDAGVDAQPNAGKNRRGLTPLCRVLTRQRRRRRYRGGRRGIAERFSDGRRGVETPRRRRLRARRERRRQLP